MFNFTGHPAKERKPAKASMPPPPSRKTDTKRPHGRDEKLENEARALVKKLGVPDGAKKLTVEWNSRLRSTAGYARWPTWRVELNPRLIDYPGEVERTLKHELAHLIAYTRAGRKRIEPHGAQWQKACAELGIPDETARHKLPLPRIQQKRPHGYICPICGFTVYRARHFRARVACSACCKRFSHGRYDPRFQLVPLRRPPQA